MSTHVAKKALYIVAAKRTACGAFGGKLKDLSATDLAVHSTQAALASINLDPKLVDSIVFGNVCIEQLLVVAISFCYYCMCVTVMPHRFSKSEDFKPRT